MPLSTHNRSELLRSDWPVQVLYKACDLAMASLSFPFFFRPSDKAFSALLETSIRIPLHILACSYSSSIFEYSVWMR
jgi:hypothetical protein